MAPVVAHPAPRRRFRVNLGLWHPYLKDTRDFVLGLHLLLQVEPRFLQNQAHPGK